MNTTTFTLETENATGAAAWIKRRAATWWREARYRTHQRRSVRHLRSLGDEHLSDLGIHRSEITSVVYKLEPKPGRKRRYE